MAIYDNNGSTNAEIGKLYDNNGTTSSQIGKVYDNNGTTNSLIYTAWNGEIYLNGDEITELTGGWTTYKGQAGSITKNTNSVTVTMTKGSYSGEQRYSIMYTANKINLTNYKTISINSDWVKCTTYDGGYPAVLAFGVTAETPPFKNANLFISPPAGLKSTNAKTSGNPSSFSVEALSGSYYIFVGLGSNNNCKSEATLTVKEIKMS